MDGMVRPEETLEWRVTDRQRDRVVGYLREAFADGRLSHVEFDDRVGRALTARTRRELNATLSGLARVPLTTTAVVRRSRTEASPSGAVGAGLIGLSPYCMGPLGPLVGVALTEKGSWTRRQVARQANFQLTAFAILITVSIILGHVGVGEILIPLGWMAWFGLTLVQAVKGFQGVDWVNPVMKVLPVKIVDEGPASTCELGWRH